MEAWRIEGRQGLSEGCLAEIRELARVCEERDGLRFKLNWEMLADRPPLETNDFVCYVGEELVGYLGLYGFGRPELELNGIVHPAFRRRGIFRRLVEEARAECARREIPKLLFICDRDAAAGAASAQRLGARYSFSEYGMELAGEPPVSERPGAIDFRVAGVDDLPVLAQLDVAGFGGSLEKAQRSADRIRKPNFLGLLGLVAGEPVGKTLVSFEEDATFVYGLCVRPADQGHGFGRAILREAILRARAKSSLPVRLEVACENPRALGLYRSCGFRATRTYDYYALILPTVFAVGG